MSTLNSANTMYGSFVRADRSSDTQVTPSVQNQTIFRSSNGFTIYTNSSLTAGVTVGAGGGSWSSVSDRNMKENFIPVNSRDILRKVLNLPISTWNYKSQDVSIRHIGAMAQDFKAAFGVGESDKMISTIDPDGGTSNGPANATYKIEGTSGQSAAGIRSGSGANYFVRSGFWTSNALVPTAGGAIVSGRVLTADGRGITNAVITLSGGRMFSPRTVQTSGFGYFTFEDVEVGQSYILTIKSKRFTFPQNSRFIALMDNMSEIVFVASTEN